MRVDNRHTPTYAEAQQLQRALVRASEGKPWAQQFVSALHERQFTSALRGLGDSTAELSAKTEAPFGNLSQQEVEDAKNTLYNALQGLPGSSEAWSALYTTGLAPDAPKTSTWDQFQQMVNTTLGAANGSGTTATSGTPALTGGGANSTGSTGTGAGTGSTGGGTSATTGGRTNYASSTGTSSAGGTSSSGRSGSTGTSGSSGSTSTGSSSSTGSTGTSTTTGGRNASASSAGTSTGAGQTSQPSSVSTKTSAGGGSYNSRQLLTSALCGAPGETSGRSLAGPERLGKWTDTQYKQLDAGIEAAAQFYPEIPKDKLAQMIIAEGAQECSGDFMMNVPGGPGDGQGFMQVTSQSVIQDFRNYGEPILGPDGSVIVDPKGKIDPGNIAQNVALWAWYTRNAVNTGQSLDQEMTWSPGAGSKTNQDFGNAQLKWFAGPSNDRHTAGGAAAYDDYNKRVSDYFVQAGFGTRAEYEALINTPLSGGKGVGVRANANATRNSTYDDRQSPYNR